MDFIPELKNSINVNINSNTLPKNINKQKNQINI